MRRGGQLVLAKQERTTPTRVLAAVMLALDAFIACCMDRSPIGDTSVADDINVLALVKGKERYIFLYDDENRSKALRTLGRYASNSELSFSWYDAAVLSQKIRRQQQKAEQPTSSRFRMPQLTDERTDDTI